MARVEFTEQAIEDLEAISEYIARDSKKYAQITIRKIYSKALLLKDFPKMGSVVPEKEDENIRQLFEGNYRIIYKIANDDLIHILFIFHSARILE